MCMSCECLYYKYNFCTQSLYNQEQKGTISALESVDGLILACMGQRVSGTCWERLFSNHTCIS